METYAQALRAGLAALQAAAVSNPQLDAMILLEHVTGTSRAHLVAHPERILKATQTKQFRRLIKQRVAHQPTAYLLGMKEFYGLKLKVTPAVLIPRPETEDMVDYLLDAKLENIYLNIYFPNVSAVKLLDVGTGAGGIAIALAQHRPRWQITATDISATALAVARANSHRHKTKIEFKQSDLLAKIDGPYHIICANLPYVRSDIKINADAKAEPHLAIFGGDDGLAYYRRFLPTISRVLLPHGLLLIEAMPDQHPELIRQATIGNLSLMDERRLILIFKQT